MHSDILLQIAIAIVAATVCAIVAKWSRQPLILGYILAGIIIGPGEGLGWISTHEIEPISELGLILLLFMIGLEIDLKKLREAGTTMVAVGIGQFVICVGLGLAVFPRLGFSSGEGSYAAVYLAIASALSSTMIVVKLLYDKAELDTAAGRITLGILVFQDIWAILFIAVQKELHDPTAAILFFSLSKGVGLVAFSLLASRFVLPVLFRSIAKVPELLVIGALAWCFFVVLVAADLGLSREMGALVAGISLSTFPYNIDVVAKVISLRDFFITLFFVTLGTKIPRPTTELLALATAGSIFLVASRFVSIVPILQLFRRGNRASILPAINLAQISEFSLVICTLGVALGHIEPRVLAVVVFMLVITSVSSTYAIMFSSQILNWINPWLKRFGMHDLDDTSVRLPAELAKPIVFVGFFRTASSLLHELLAWNPHLADDIERAGLQSAGEGGAGPTGDPRGLRRHQPPRHAGPCERRVRAGARVHDPRQSPQGNDQPAAAAEAAVSRPRGDDHRHDGRARPGARALSRGGELRLLPAADECARAGGGRPRCAHRPHRRGAAGGDGGAVRAGGGHPVGLSRSPRR